MGQLTLFKFVITYIVEYTEKCRIRRKTGENKDDRYFISCQVCAADVEGNSPGQAPRDSAREFDIL
jgi:hypothetical protein